MNYFTTVGGFDSAVMSGSIPEVVMIGVPAATNGTACPTINTTTGETECWQRRYEFTPTTCDTSVSHECDNGGKAGGADVTFQFISDTLIKSVMENLGMTAGEVSIAGYSLGGMTACYAASSLPKLFQRAFCMSPSVWWNNNDMEKIVLDNGLKFGTPLSVVVEVGNVENGYSNYLYEDPNSIPPVLWSEQIGAMVNSFVSIGMGKVPSDYSKGLQYLTESNLHYYIHNSGMHSLISWGDVFTHSIILMYRYDFPDKQKSQLDRSLVYEYPPQAPHSSDSNEFLSNDGEIVYAVLFPIFTFILGLVVMHFYYVRKVKQDGTTDKNTPMARLSTA